ncbi:MAG: MFS transporter [Rhodanobacteraceae bacterium]
MPTILSQKRASHARPPGAYDFIAMALVLAVGMAGTTLPTPLYPLYQQQLGLSDFAVAAIFATYAFAVLGTLIATGPWSDQVGRRPILAAGLVAATASSSLFLIGGGLEILLIARALSGISAGLFTATATIAVIELAPVPRKTHAAVLAAIANMGGLGAGPLLAGVVSQFFAWPLHLVYAVHLILLAGAGIVVWRCPETVALPVHPHLHGQRLELPPGVRAAFIPAAIACVAGFALLGLLTSLEPEILGKLVGVSNRASVGALVFLVFLASLGGQLLQRHLADATRLPLACAVLALGSAMLGASMADKSLALLVLGAVTSGLGQGGVFAASVVTVTAASPREKRAEVTSLLFVVIYAAVAIPVLSLGGVIAVTDLRIAGIAFAALVMLLSITALVVLQGHRAHAPMPNTRRPHPSSLKYPP